MPIGRRILLYFMLIVAFTLSISMCTPSFGQQQQPNGNATSNFYARGMLSADSVLRAARLLKVYTYFDSTGSLAVVGLKFYFHNGVRWVAGQFDSTTIYIALKDSMSVMRDSVNRRVRYTDSNTVYVTPFQLKDSVSGRVKYIDSNTIYVTPFQLYDSVISRVKYIDSTTLFVTKKQLKDSVATRVKYIDSNSIYVTPLQLYDSVSGRVKYTDSITIYVTPKMLSDSIKRKIDTSGIAGNIYSIPVFSARHSLTSSTFYDSTNLGHAGVNDTFTVWSTLYLKTVPVAVNADSILVKGSTRGTVRVVPPPTGTAGIDVVWPANVYSLTAVGTAGTYGSTSAIPIITVDAYGRAIAITTTSVAIGYVIGTGLTLTTTTLTNNLSTGVSGGQTLIGGTAASNNLTVRSTSNGTKGNIIFDSKLTWAGSLGAITHIEGPSDQLLVLNGQSGTGIDLRYIGVSKLQVSSSGGNILVGSIMLWNSGLGAITHLLGPNDNTLRIGARTPVQISTALSGNELDLNGGSATAGSSVAGAAAGGGIVLTTGSAARLTSGNAGGGAFSIGTGTGIGTGTSGRYTLKIGSTLVDSADNQQRQVFVGMNTGTVVTATGNTTTTIYPYQTLGYVVLKPTSNETIKIGTTSGAADVMASTAFTGGTTYTVVPLIQTFSLTATQTLFIQGASGSVTYVFKTY